MTTGIRLVLLAGLCSTGLAAERKPTPKAVRALTQRVADWQIATFEDAAKYRAVSAGHRARYEAALKAADEPPEVVWATFFEKRHDLLWHNGALYVGLDQWRRVAEDPRPYANFLMKIGGRNAWRLHTRPYHADDHTVAQAYLSLYRDFQNPAMLAPTRERFDWILANPKTGSLTWCGYRKPYTTDCHDRWGWCDALFMAPPVWARLASITDERKYLEFMDREYHATYDLLWDKEEHFFWRDTSYFPKREKNGRKLFWARGNGWVFGGLALMIPDLPAEWEGRAFYIDLFRQMAARLKSIQRPDGTWSMGLLGGVEAYPVKETSGTAFFAFGLAWGVNNGLLDRAEYEPIILEAWAALAACVSEDGLLGHVQPVGGAPGDSYPDKSEVYGVGAFLAAGAEVYKLVGGTVEAARSEEGKP